MKQLIIITILFLFQACKEPVKTISNPSLSANDESVDNNNDSTLFAFKWQLIELMENQVADSINGQVPFIEFFRQESRVSGTAGCNRFGGTFNLQGGHRIKFSQVFSTKMACQDMSVEQEFFNVLDKTEHYEIRENLLFFGRTKNTLLAKFRAIKK